MWCVKLFYYTFWKAESLLQSYTTKSLWHSGYGYVALFHWQVSIMLLFIITKKDLNFQLSLEVTNRWEFYSLLFHNTTLLYLADDCFMLMLTFSANIHVKHHVFGLHFPTDRNSNMWIFAAFSFSCPCTQFILQKLDFRLAATINLLFIYTFYTLLMLRLI